MSLGRPRVLGADHHAIGLHEVVDRRALLEELGIAHHAEGVRRLQPDDLADLLARADRHGALVDDDLVAVHRAGDLTGDVEHVRQVGRSVLTLRRADGDEHDGRVANGLRQVGGEVEAPFLPVAADDLLEPGS